MAIETSVSRPRRTAGWDLSPFAAIAALLAAAPLVAVAVLAVSGPLDDYLLHVAQTRLADYLSNSAIVGVTAAVGAGSVGVITAWLVARAHFPGRRFFQWALALPLAVPAYVAAYAWLDLSQGAGPIKSALRDGGIEWLAAALPTVRGPFGAGLIFAFTLYPYVYLLARESFSSQSVDTYDAARTLGYGPVAAFRRTALPMARPAIAAGMALVIMESLADYGAVAHLGAPTLTVGIVRAWAGAGALADAARLALLLAAIALVIFSAERAQRRRARISTLSGRTRPPRRERLHGWTGAGATLLCALPLLIALVIPLARMGWLALEAPAARGLLDAFRHSAILASTTGVLAAGLGLLTAYAVRRGSWFAKASSRLASLGYAAPGAVAAVGVIAVLSLAQSGLDAVWGGVFPILLTSTVLALIFAYLSRFAAAAIGPCESALERVTPALDGAARTLGERPLGVLRRVHWPLVSGGAITAGLIVFVEVLKELPATMILRPFNFDTLAVIAHNYASDERLGQAGAPAFALVLTALLPMIYVARRIVKDSALEDLG
tara:strand:+ start:602 stop:2251 length:1650 start_codon:yes stop_codon:yes gene_type:complete